MTDALFFSQMVMVYDDLEEVERVRLKRHMFLARFGKQSVLQWRDMEAREVRKYAEALADLLKEESKAQKDTIEQSGR